jgi:aerobic carbon-monoxide dehydrogenase small subunit
MQLSMQVNGRTVKLDVPANRLLSQCLREDLSLTGTHVGCDTVQCGACTVLVDGAAVKSCNVLAVQCEGHKITTIEGLAAADGTLHPVQVAFNECHALQCGFCTPGMIMSIVDLCARVPNADEAQIRKQLDGNYCRCTGYQNIVRAVEHAQRALAARGGAT